MNVNASASWQRDDGRLRLGALGFSLLVNLLGWLVIGLGGTLAKRDSISMQAPEATREEPAVLWIEPIPADEFRKRFVRTSVDVSEAAVADPQFIGERSTRPASSRAPVADAPALPSQSGIQPRHDADIETTESDYRDGSLEPESSRDAAEPRIKPAATPPATAQSTREMNAATATPKAPSLLQGSETVDVTVPSDTTDATPTAPKTIVPDPAPSSAPSREATPAFRGNQRRTALVGSISRSGASALDVEDTMLGRYQAAVGRAVEREWQRNCARHRDFITPGFLTMRFFVGEDGRVRSVQFVGDMETGEVQKGFTLQSIRNADIPPMPSALRRELGREPLELIFRFYF
jgi:hypothetical protein